MTEAAREAAEARNPFERSLGESNLFPLMSESISVFQMNLGRVCNLSCRHCHVGAGPGRTEAMDASIVDECLRVIKRQRYPTLDITGGAPEMNANYRRLVETASSFGINIKTRTNLTILTKDGYTDLPEFFARNRVEVVASLPYFSSETTDRQRGGGVFASSIEALRALNSVGYGVEGSGLKLFLVYNPCGAFLPPPEKSIEADFRRELKKRHGVSFTGLFTITNMPVGRFLEFLNVSGNFIGYMERLKSSYNPEAAVNVMCRNTISVAWDGSLYDCDFNQMLGLKCGGPPDHIRDFDHERLSVRRIVTGAHCYGCTAGAGSSCAGAVAR
ncbi:MAG: arsenosugar biosynthesis radical SAM protein ArsS [Deltaproteobacteria bacterium]|nr:arsenosugar biosynthesis radical SAM protein ArsS [Deltaproteobacteria bacterium]